MSRVVIVDAGGANIGSVRYALQRLGVDAPLSGDAAMIRAAERVILPGVGSAGAAMQRLHELELVQTLRDLRQPLLGICVGMQVLFERSKEGDVACLGLLQGEVGKLPESDSVRVPHIGWNRVRHRGESGLFEGTADGAFAYFVHGFAAPATSDCIATCEHGVKFAAAVQRGHLVGVQFHPERSATFGAQVLRNFLEFAPA